MSNTKKLLEIIRKAVRQEVRTVVREELQIALGTKKELKSEHITHGINLAELASAPQNPYEQGNTDSTKKQKDFEFTRDPVLNKVLNETANAKDEWKTMGGGAYTDGKSGLASAMGMGSAEQMFGGKPSAQQMLPNDRKGVQLSDEMADVLTKDYSALMKAIDKKKGKR